MYRILIVEDDATMAKAMKTQIDSWGNQAETVKDFQNVISAFLNFDPHMVLMDIMLPFIMAITGAVKYGKFPMCLWYLFLLLLII